MTWFSEAAQVIVLIVGGLYALGLLIVTRPEPLRHRPSRLSPPEYVMSGGLGVAVVLAPVVASVFGLLNTWDFIMLRSFKGLSWTENTLLIEQPNHVFNATEMSFKPVGQPYPFAKGKFVNLDGNPHRQGRPAVGAHSDIVYPKIAWAVLRAAGVASPRERSQSQPGTSDRAMTATWCARRQPTRRT